MKHPRGFACAGLALGLWFCAGREASAVNIVFDFRYDTGLYFGGTNVTHTNAWRRACLEQAADELEARLGDRLAAIIPQPSSNLTWVSEFLHPSAPSLTTLIYRTNDVIAADRILVFVGARSQPDPYDAGSYAYAEAGGVSTFRYAATVAGSNWYDAVLWRGQTGATLVSGTRINTNDFAPWGGCLSFGTTRNWYFNTNGATGVPAGRPDFHSFAVHELAHLLGFGLAGDPFSSQVNARGSWSARVNVNNATFLGSNSVALYGAPVPLDAYALHWKEGTVSSAEMTALSQEAEMDPTLNAGVRKGLTLLDWAALKDIGWNVLPRCRTEFAVTDMRAVVAGSRREITLAWRAQPGESNTVQFATSMAGPFTNVGDPILATNLSMSATFTNTSPNGFYRVRMGAGW